LRAAVAIFVVAVGWHEGRKQSRAICNVIVDRQTSFQAPP